MKTIITFTFLLFSYLGFSQTTREEVVKRNEYGQKLVVNTYTGTGNSEKLIKSSHYSDDYGFIECGGCEFPVSLNPTLIEYFGKYKQTINILKDFKSYRIGDEYVYTVYGKVKKEYFYGSGTLYKTWTIEEDDGENDFYKIKHTLIP